MKSTFTLFQSHLDLAHNYWERLVMRGDTVIDATCGNGHDTLFLANLALTSDSGEMIGMDVQGEAIQNTKSLLQEHLSPHELGRVRLVQGCHTIFPESVTNGSVRLVVYNLGYLPGGDKNRTTMTQTTYESLQSALKLICPGGAISITCYPGHAEGGTEQKKILDYVQNLDPKEWSCCHHEWLNRNNAPSLLLLQKKSANSTL